MNLADKRVLLISYHAYSKGSYRPTILHRYFTRRVNDGEIGHYGFIASDWDHMTKSRQDFSGDPRIQALSVPPYGKNLSWQRIWSHLVFSAKLFFSDELRRADVVVVCVPPSLTALPVVLITRWRGRASILDLVDLWPEALPVSTQKKVWFMASIGWLWSGIRNFLYRRATRLLSHCQFFLTQIGRVKCERASYLPLSQLDVSLLTAPSTRKSLNEEIRVLVLGSINHVLDSGSLVRILMALSQIVTDRKLVLEIIGEGESKKLLLDGVRSKAPRFEIIDHGLVFDIGPKTEILTRCHFGFNGYRDTSAIGITYKSIDFTSAGLLFINSVQGDLTQLVESYGVGFNYVQGKETHVATQIARLSDPVFLEKSAASRRLAYDHFHPDRFERDFSGVLDGLPEPK